MELLQVQASKFLGGGVHVPCCPELDERGCGVARPLAERGAVACPLTLITCPWHSEPDVETLSSGIVSAFIIGVGVTEAVVACGQERRIASGSRSPEKSTPAHASSSS